VPCVNKRGRKRSHCLGNVDSKKLSFVIVIVIVVVLDIVTTSAYQKAHSTVESVINGHSRYQISVAIVDKCPLMTDCYNRERAAAEGRPKNRCSLKTGDRKDRWDCI
jgi:hypothetical protein